MFFRISCSGNVHKQSGAVLVISLIMLMLLSLIGITASQTTGLEEKMAGNFRDKNLAFQAAESALKVAEDSLTGSPTFDANGTDGYYSNSINKTKATTICATTATSISATTLTTAQTSTCLAEAIAKDSFWATTTNNHDSGLTLNGIARAPRYVIQRLDCASPPCTAGPYNYRITARATGGTNNAVVILESIFQYPGS